MAGVTEDRGTITNITQAKPPVVTSSSHGLSNGDIVRITEIVGMSPLRNGRFRVDFVDTNTFVLQDPSTHEAIDASQFELYQSGGQWNKTDRVGADRIIYES